MAESDNQNSATSAHYAPKKLQVICSCLLYALDPIPQEISLIHKLFILWWHPKRGLAIRARIKTSTTIISPNLPLNFSPQKASCLLHRHLKYKLSKIELTVFPRKPDTPSVFLLIQWPSQKPGSPPFLPHCISRKLPKSQRGIIIS